MEIPSLLIDGAVETPLQLTCDHLARLLPEHQIEDVSQLDPKRRGRAIRFASLLNLADMLPTATHVGLHGTRDDFHASIPLAPVLERAVIIYEVDGLPLEVSAGGPFRFFIPDHAACHTDEVDECANVKFLDRIELTIGPGYDNRPQDDNEHARLHDQQSK